MYLGLFHAYYSFALSNLSIHASVPHYFNFLGFTSIFLTPVRATFPLRPDSSLNPWAVNLGYIKGQERNTNE